MKLAIIAIVGVIYGIIISIPNAYIQPVLADSSSSSSHDSGKGGGGKSDDSGGGGKSDDSGGSAEKCNRCVSKSTSSSPDDHKNENQVSTPSFETSNSASGSTTRQLQNNGPISSTDGNNDNQGIVPHLGTSTRATDALTTKGYQGQATGWENGHLDVNDAKGLGQLPDNAESAPVNDAKGLGQLPGGIAENEIGHAEAADVQAATQIPGGSTSGIENGVTREQPQIMNEAPSRTQLINSPLASQSINTTNTTSSRDELLDKVSTPEELHTILTKFRSFIDDDSVNSVVNSSLGKVSTTPTNSYGVSYSWEPTNTIMKEEHSILMLKFTDAAGNIIKNSNIDYDILIKDPNTNNSVFQKHGSTPTGVDLKIIDGNSFPTAGSQSNKIDYNVEVVVNSVGGNIASEHASLSKVAVMSYNQ
jgi:hypothetical protein